MKPMLPLRIASGLSLVFALGHLAGGLNSWSPVGDTRALGDMARFHFDVGGMTRTLLDFYLGFGVFIGIYLLMQAAVLWQLAAIAKTDPQSVRPIVASFLLATIGATYVAWRFLFAIPVVFSVAIAVCLAAGLLLCARGKLATAR